MVKWNLSPEPIKHTCEHATSIECVRMFTCQREHVNMTADTLVDMQFVNK